MEKRKHPRIRLPILVEIQHPAIGREKCVARDISEGGVFVEIQNPRVKPGAKVKLTLLNSSSVDSQPTPTVEMEVKRVEKQGLGLSFINKTSRHLWASVERLREELAVGRDYFQVHVSCIVLNAQGELLIVQQNGKWVFPGLYLVVGESWRDAVRRMLKATFALVPDKLEQIVNMETESSDAIPEAAVVRLHTLMMADDSTFSFTADKRYRDWKWTNRRRDMDELTFSDQTLRQLATQAIDWHREQNQEIQ